MCGFEGGRLQRLRVSDPRERERRAKWSEQIEGDRDMPEVHQWPLSRG